MGNDSRSSSLDSFGELGSFKSRNPINNKNHDEISFSENNSPICQGGRLRAKLGKNTYNEEKVALIKNGARSNPFAPSVDDGGSSYSFNVDRWGIPRLYLYKEHYLNRNLKMTPLAIPMIILTILFFIAIILVSTLEDNKDVIITIDVIFSIIVLALLINIVGYATVEISVEVTDTKVLIINKYFKTKTYTIYKDQIHELWKCTRHCKYDDVSGEREIKKDKAPYKDVEHHVLSFFFGPNRITIFSDEGLFTLSDDKTYSLYSSLCSLMNE